jgi:hypothetical protein
VIAVLEVEVQPSAHHVQVPHHLGVALLALVHRHVVDDLAHAVLGEDAGHEDVRGAPGRTGAAHAVGAQGEEIDPETGLIVGEGLAVVKANCTACHSPKLIVQSRGTREDWTGMIRWMQRTQQLWSFPPAVENTILDYLSAHYGAPRVPSRRRPLPEALLPPKPEYPRAPRAP